VTLAWKTRLQAGPGEAYSTVTALLHSSSNRQRVQLLTDLAALTPALVALGGPDTAVATAQAIQEVGCWWP